MKAVFMDYTGTTVQEKGPEIEEAIMRIWKNSSLSGPEEALDIWWSRLHDYETSCYQETYLNEDEITGRMLEELEQNYQLRDSREQLHNLIRGFWVNAPLFPDVASFYRACPVPIYIISNNGIPYVEASVKKKGLTPAGIICSDMVRAYKPHRELFEKALEVSGCSPSEAIHIGDSYSSDALGAMSAGICPILVQRKKKEPYADVICVGSLEEVLTLSFFTQEEIS